MRFLVIVKISYIAEKKREMKYDESLEINGRPRQRLGHCIRFKIAKIDIQRSSLLLLNYYQIYIVYVSSNNIDFSVAHVIIYH